jgi:hypothetical protein
MVPEVQGTTAKGVVTPDFLTLSRLSAIRTLGTENRRYHQMSMRDGEQNCQFWFAEHALPFSGTRGSAKIRAKTDIGDNWPPKNTGSPHYIFLSLIRLQ